VAKRLGTDSCKPATFKCLWKTLLLLCFMISSMLVIVLLTVQLMNHLLFSFLCFSCSHKNFKSFRPVG
jgi:hypothetical protein